MVPLSCITNPDSTHSLYDQIVLTVEATDMGSLPRASTCLVEIQVEDVNDHRPQLHFEPSKLTAYALVPENEAPGRLVAVFTAHDADSGENGRVTCRLVDTSGAGIHSGSGSGPTELSFGSTETSSSCLYLFLFPGFFSLSFCLLFFPITTRAQTCSYKLTTAAMFDREVTPTIFVWILCSDHGQPPHHVTGSVLVRIQDVNDEAPNFGRHHSYFTVNEATAVGDALFTVNATDRDEGE
ncbi:unnamed protein product [Protopolystoma xenopodis]|uniref:Cadherin domain-containing protein n=1 Tax=Protopolystoma xenopodis TaxID=117903 RepID=A0A448XH63_9PLAT|nr:unnamed protein product [Protopolystoma xenopodis]